MPELYVLKHSFPIPFGILFIFLISVAIFLIMSTLRRFIFDWESYKEVEPEDYYANGDRMLQQYADILLDIAAQVYESIPEDVITSLTLVIILI